MVRVLGVLWLGFRVFRGFMARIWGLGFQGFQGFYGLGFRV